ncbi:hypothetical protein, partial [Acinetobacter nosocomialis]|uniref:hypothetical protein n=1 Tax=Acinetobacter nosocomialis TaxID=106654 RepID=UPI0013D835D7
AGRDDAEPLPVPPRHGAVNPGCRTAWSNDDVRLVGSPTGQAERQPQADGRFRCPPRAASAGGDQQQP